LYPAVEEKANDYSVNTDYDEVIFDEKDDDASQEPVFGQQLVTTIDIEE
jgi:hypothetical protein